MTVTSMKTRRTRPVRLVTEAVRERETFKYNPSLVADSRYNSDGRLYPSSELTTASDSVLTALALLGAIQTGTERAFISLFDSNHQYIIAEASPSIPITSRFPSGDCTVPLSLCGTAIPRTQGTCDHVLYLPASQDSDDEAELPLSFVTNLATDPRFSSRPYCQFGDRGQFYAGVPIRTRRGINIGAYCVMNPTVPDNWDDLCTRRLRDISNAIMEHLECNRSKRAYWRSERMNRGLSSFMEGKAALTGWQSREAPEVSTYHCKLKQSLSSKEQCVESQEQDSGVTIEVIPGPSPRITPQLGSATADRPVDDPEGNVCDRVCNAHINRAVHDQEAEKQSRPTKISSPNDDTSTPFYSNAANIIREAFDVEGCYFFDVTVGSYKSMPGFGHDEGGNVDSDNSLGKLSTTSSSEEQVHNSTAAVPDELCEVIGFSTTEASSVNGAESFGGRDVTFPKKLLAKLLRRYPDGKIFNFDAIGELQSSDSSEDDGALVTGNDKSPSLREEGDVKSEATCSTHNNKHRRQLKESAMIHQAFPAARSVAFIPVWDWKRERWFAGGFVYTLSPSRLLSVEEDLSILWAFARLISTEVLNSEAMKENKAKSDALGSLSHELRSPLHGVILGTELLNDTELSVFQENTIRTIETCCRTLLDTIDHLLDYSKVNSLAAKRKQRDEIIPPQLRKAARFNDFGKKTLYSNISLDGLVEEVVESVFAGFSFQQLSIQQIPDSDKFRSKRTSTAAFHRMDALQAMDQLLPNIENADKQGCQIGNIAVYLAIDPTCNWMFSMQGGSFRRIVMNLLGNSLKYTSKGTIRISLIQDLPNSRRPKTERVVKLMVQDTGKGISEDYLQHKLFKPFSQEDELASGTGLGLSLVKKIVSQLRGRIYVESQVGVGTSVIVTLPVEVSQQSSDLPLEMIQDDESFREQLCELRGLRIRIFGFGSEGDCEQRTLVEDICKHWLHLELVSDYETTPDIMLWSESALPEVSDLTDQIAEAPNVVICNNALRAYERSIIYDNADRGGLCEFISQPIGPRKIAKSILLTYKQWIGRNLPKMLRPSRRPALSRAGSAYREQQSTDEVAIEKMLPTEPAIDTEKAQMRLVTPDPRPSFQSQTEPVTVFASSAQSEFRGHLIYDKKILIVDDNHINRTILSVYMGKLGGAYEAVTNGQEAVSAYTKGPSLFNGILMDISMPIMDGLEATRRIRAYEHRNQLRAVTILALTGLSSESTHQEALSSGVDVFLTKPVRLKALSEILESLNILALPHAYENKVHVEKEQAV